MSDIDKPAAVKLTVSQGKKSVFTFHPLVTEAPPEQQQQQRRQSPADWAAEYIAKVKAAPDSAALAAIEARAKNTVASLKEKYPDLFKRVSDAVTEREASFEAPNFDDGPDDGHRGERFNGTDPADGDVPNPFETEGA